MSKAGEIFLQVLASGKAAKVEGTPHELKLIQEGVLKYAQRSGLLLGNRRISTWKSQGLLYIDLTDAEEAA